QLNCDTLRLTLVPAEPPPPSRKSPPRQDPAPRPAAAPAGSGPAATRPNPPAEKLVLSEAGRQGTGTESPSRPAPEAEAGAGSTGASKGLFGNLTLQKANATGHAVWLQLREQEAKVLCVELIHERRAPYKPDRTYFRGD